MAKILYLVYYGVRAKKNQGRTESRDHITGGNPWYLERGKGMKIIMLGAPGAGKGTQAKKLPRNMEFLIFLPEISSGPTLKMVQN